MYQEAVGQREVLVRYGLSDSVLQEFGAMLEEFDAAPRLGLEGGTTHTAARRELSALTVEVGRVVRGMDARNRLRFRDDLAVLEQWTSARTVLGGRRRSSAAAPSPEGARTRGDVRPAA